MNQIILSSQNRSFRIKKTFLLHWENQRKKNQLYLPQQRNVVTVNQTPKNLQKNQRENLKKSLIKYLQNFDVQFFQILLLTVILQHQSINRK